MLQIIQITEYHPILVDEPSNLKPNGVNCWKISKHSSRIYVMSYSGTGWDIDIY